MASTPTSDGLMSLDEYLEVERQCLGRLADQWRLGMQAKAQYFPARLPEGDWFEAYTTFDEDSNMVQCAPEASAG